MSERRRHLLSGSLRIEFPPELLSRECPGKKKNSPLTVLFGKSIIKDGHKLFIESLYNVSFERVISRINNVA